MKEIIYNKLVRDNIPSIIQNDNEIAVMRILKDEEYRVELYKKLQEECNELLAAKTSEEIIEESADVFEVLSAIALLEGRDFDAIVQCANQKRLKKGGFSKRLFLEKSIRQD